LAALARVRRPPALGDSRTTGTSTTSIRSITSTAEGNDIMTTPFLPADPTAPTVYDIVDSPVGRLLLTGAAPADDVRALTGLYLLDAGPHSASVQAGWARRPGGPGGAGRPRGGGFRAVAAAGV